MFTRFLFATFLAVISVLVPIVGAAQNTQKEGQDVILVLDGSGSMWGQIEGVTKIEIARDAVATMVQDWDENTNLGLIAYGHREKGNCSDIETILPVGSVKPSAFSAAVNAINPRGKTPLSDAVRLAAETMKYTENKATVILVSDGIETCNADPCALARELDTNGVDFTAHVIGFGLGEGDQRQLACLAENTGGQFIAAGNASELDLAISETVAVVESTKTVVTIKDTGPTGLRPILVACADCEPIEKDLRWDLFAYDPAISAAGEKLNTAYRSDWYAELAPGKYVLRGRWGEASSDLLTEVLPGEVAEPVVNLNAGTIRVSTVTSKDGAPLDDGLRYQVFETKTDLQGNRERIVTTYQAQQDFHLPAGEYYVVARVGEAEAGQTLAVAPGDVTAHQFNLGSGLLKLTAIPTAGAEVLKNDMRFRVLNPERDLAGKREVIATSYEHDPLFTLPAGSYDVQATHGAAVVEKRVEIGSGAEVADVIDMNVGYVRVSALPAAGRAPVKKDVRFQILTKETNLEGKRTRVAVKYEGEDVILRVPAGDYILAAKHGPAETMTEISVTAGSLLDKDVITNTGILVVTANPAAGVDFSNPSWRLSGTSADGRVETYGYGKGGTAEFIAPAGLSELRLTLGQKQYTFPADVIAGQRNELMVNVE